MVKITIEFESNKVAKEFSDWLNNQGEQEYWMYCKAAGRPMASSFDYGLLKKGTILIKAT